MVAVFCRNQQQIVKTILCVVPGLGFVLAAFGFIYGRNHLIPIWAHFDDEFFIFACNFCGVEQQDNYVGAVNHVQRSFNNVVVQLGLFCAYVAGKLVAAGINKVNRLSVYDCSCFNRVAGNTWLVVYDSYAVVQKAVEEGRFSNVRAAGNYNKGKVIVFSVFRVCVAGCGYSAVRGHGDSVYCAGRNKISFFGEGLFCGFLSFFFQNFFLRTGEVGF